MNQEQKLLYDKILVKGFHVEWDGKDKFNKIISGKKFNYNEKVEIVRGLILGLDVSWYADPKFNSIQMFETVKG